jgi:hypothetical protein
MAVSLGLFVLTIQQNFPNLSERSSQRVTVEISAILCDLSSGDIRGAGAKSLARLAGGKFRKPFSSTKAWFIRA